MISLNFQKCLRKCIATEEFCKQKLIYFRYFSNAPSSSSPEFPERKWITVNDQRSGKTNQRDGTSFLVMSYNILSQYYVHLHRNLYADHNPVAMQWENRLSALKSEIIQCRPDILCLQEVQNNHLDELRESFKDLDFDKPLYKKRNGSQVDGCAIFFNQILFDLVETHYVEYYQPNVRVLNRCNVAIIAKLALKTNRNVQFVVSTTHLLFNPRRHDIRLAQVQVLLAELDRIAHNNETRSSNKSIPIILTGDFNLQENSKPYQLLNGSPVNVDSLFKSVFQIQDKLLPIELGITDNCQHYHVAAKNQRHQTALYHSTHHGPMTNRKTILSKSNAKPTIETNEIIKSGLAFNTGTLTHNLNLESTLGLLNHQNEAMASTFHHKWIKVDYIFFTKYQCQQKFDAKLKLLAKYQLPTVDECIRIGLIPNENLGSDHYSMAARFAILENRN